MLHIAPQPPVHQRAQHVAEGGHRHQCPGWMRLGQQQAHQHRLGLQRQQGGGAEGGEEQAQVGGGCQHACVSETGGASVAADEGQDKAQRH
ncbi:hypothetical protein D9M71_679270 [compost metagenome]